MTNLEKVKNVNVPLKANVYFEGKCISHTLEHADGTKQTVGVIFPGTYKFNTGAPERMDILAGACRVRLAGEEAWQSVTAGSGFNAPGQAFFEISVETGLLEYLCSFL
jgi:hypothetical protein